MCYSFVRPLLFRLKPEVAHHFTLQSLKFFSQLGLTKLLFKPMIDSPQNVMGLPFPNPVGLAAGLDKNGEFIDALSKLGFGFIEVGTVTPRPQPGNPKPRLFRLPPAQALINRFGFNSKGVEYLVNRVKATKYKGILGINIGKNFDTPLEKAVEDYLFCLERVYAYASYITINISSPNTVGLRHLQYGGYLEELLASLRTKQTELAQSHQKHVPLVVKIAPDLNLDELTSIAQTFLKQRIDAVIAGNTTIDHDAVAGLKHAEEKGGLSGKPLFPKALSVVHWLKQHLRDEIPIIACGGITSGQDAKEMLEAGASLLQIYTGLIYQGPKLIPELVRATLE